MRDDMFLLWLWCVGCVCCNQMVWRAVPRRGLGLLPNVLASSMQGSVDAWPITWRRHAPRVSPTNWLQTHTPPGSQAARGQAGRPAFQPGAMPPLLPPCAASRGFCA